MFLTTKVQPAKPSGLHLVNTHPLRATRQRADDCHDGVVQRARPALRCSLSTRALGVLVPTGIYKDATFRICAHVPQNTCGTANVSSEELNPGVLNVLNALPLPRRLDALANATRHGARRSPRKLRLFKRSGNNHGDGEASV